MKYKRFNTFFIWVLGLPYYYLLKFFDLFPYWNFPRRRLDEFTDEDVRRMVTRRINAAFALFVGLMLGAYLTLRFFTKNKTLFDIIFFGVGALLFFGANICRMVQIDIFVEEVKTKGVKDYFE
jgi:hypothetical protein